MIHLPLTLLLPWEPVPGAGLELGQEILHLKNCRVQNSSWIAHHVLVLLMFVGEHLKHQAGLCFRSQSRGCSCFVNWMLNLKTTLFPCCILLTAGTQKPDREQILYSLVFTCDGVVYQGQGALLQALCSQRGAWRRTPVSVEGCTLYGLLIQTLNAPYHERVHKMFLLFGVGWGVILAV